MFLINLYQQKFYIHQSKAVYGLVLYSLSNNLSVIMSVAYGHDLWLLPNFKILVFYGFATINSCLSDWLYYLRCL